MAKAKQVKGKKKVDDGQAHLTFFGQRTEAGLAARSTPEQEGVEELFFLIRANENRVAAIEREQEGLRKKLSLFIESRVQAGVDAVNATDAGTIPYRIVEYEVRVRSDGWVEVTMKRIVHKKGGAPVVGGSFSPLASENPWLRECEKIIERLLDIPKGAPGPRICLANHYFDSDESDSYK